MADQTKTHTVSARLILRGADGYDEAPSGGSDGMLAMVLTTGRETRLERRPVPKPRDDQVLVDVDLCGICGSDLHAPDLPEVYLGGFIMGHEPAGRIAGVGRNVSGWGGGPRGALHPDGAPGRGREAGRLRAADPLHPGNDGTGCGPAGRRRAGGTRGGLTKNSARLAGRDGPRRVWLGGARRRRAARRAGRRGTQRAVGARRRWRSDGAVVLPARAALRGGARLAERAVRRTPQLRRSLTGRPRIR